MRVDTEALAALTKDDLERLSLEDLQARFVELAAPLAVISNARALLDEIIKRRVRQATATNRVRAMDTDTKVALKRALDDDAKVTAAAATVAAEDAPTK